MTSAKTSPSPSLPARLLALIGRCLFWVLFLAMIAWAVMAIYYSDLPPNLRLAAAPLFGAASLAVLLFVRPRRRGILVFLAAFAFLVAWWLKIPPSNERDWQPDVAVLPWATINGNQVTIHNIRNCDYRSETDYTVRHYDKTFDLAKLRSADLFIVYWGSPYIAHTMFSFDFTGGDYVCFSIETRKEKGEEYSAIKGFFKQYELTYIVADERDVVRLRTNYRGEDVYLYRLEAAPELARKVFLSYLREVNLIHDNPEWYNAMTSNCTTNIRGHTAPFVKHHRFNWRILVNGYLDTLLYERGYVDQGFPFDELKRRSYINPRAKAAGNTPDFSQRIREGLPGTGPRGEK